MICTADSVETVTYDLVRGAVVEAVLTVRGIRVPETGGDELSLVVYEIDSLDLVEIGMIVEQGLGVELDSELFGEVATLGDVIGVIAAQVKSQR